MEEITYKLKALEKIENKSQPELTKLDFSELLSLAQDSNSEIRSRVAQILASIPCQHSENILLLLINDKEELVRVNACDSLSFSTSIDTLKLLLKKVKHETWLVRMYAISSIGDITCSINSSPQTYKVSWLLEKMLKVEESESVRLSYYVSLVKLGKRKYYRNILKKLDAKDYRVRCIAVHSLLELVEKEQYSLTKYKLEKRLAIETSFAVKDNIQHALFELDKIQ